ncbi:MAG: NitT/TauT family transport system substrate-binding protein [Methyloprofundus sp.]|nr:MAG: NitT/TauT family transport system substrate-binding protein [Methyloprofundus sp.]
MSFIKFVRSSLFFRCLTLLGLLFLNGCEPTPQSVLKIGTNLWVGYESLYLAQDLGYFDDKSIKLIEMPSATEVSHAFRNRALDAVALTLDEALVLIQYEPDLRVILVMDVSAGADALLAKPTIPSLTELKGKRIGVENSAVGAILLDGALQAAKLSINDVKFQSIMANEHESAYKKGLIDAIVTFEPHKSILISQGAITLFDSTQIPGRIVDVLVTRQSVIEQHKDTLKIIVAAHFKALEYLDQNTVDATLRIAPRLAVQSNEVMNQFEGITLPGVLENHNYLSVESHILSTSVEELTSLMTDKQLLFKPIDTSKLINGSLLPEK